MHEIPGHKGGVRKWQSVQDEISLVLKTSSQQVCTIMFDFYKLDQSWPGLESARLLSISQVASAIEHALANHIEMAMPTIHPKRFIPYIQMHEYEALLFADANKLAEALPGGAAKHTQTINGILAAVSSPEEINTGAATHPAKRIAQMLPNYEKAKTIEGINLAQSIGIQSMLKTCHHFASWVNQLLALSYQDH